MKRILSGILAAVTILCLCSTGFAAAQTPSAASTTRKGDFASSRSARMRVKTGGMCCTTRMGTGIAGSTVGGVRWGRRQCRRASHCWQGRETSVGSGWR